jgi:hypothetical protein
MPAVGIHGWMCIGYNGFHGRAVLPSSSEHDKRLRAELAEELGFYPASLDEASVARRRDARGGQPDRHVEKKWAHHRTAKERAAREAAMEAAVADLYE